MKIPKKLVTCEFLVEQGDKEYVVTLYNKQDRRMKMEENCIMCQGGESIEWSCPECGRIIKESANSGYPPLGIVLAEIESTESISSDDCLWIPREALLKVLSKYFV